MRSPGSPRVAPRSRWTCGRPRSPRSAPGVGSPRPSRRTPTSGSRTARPRVASCAPTTRRQYRMLLETFIYPTFGDERIDRITNEDVNAWYDALAPGRETIRAQSYSLLRTIFASAASERPTPLDPVQPGPHPRSRKHQARPPRAAGEPRGAPDHRRGAARPLQADGPARGLVRDAVRRAGRTAPRRHRPAHQPGEDPQGSGARRRRVPRRPTQVGCRRARRRHPAASGATGEGPPEEPHRARQGTRCSSRRPRATTCTWRRRRSTRSTTRRGRPLVVEDLRWHDLRHTGAVLAAQTGATLAELMGRLGHSTPGAAMRYQHAAADRDAEIARRLSALAGDP